MRVRILDENGDTLNILSIPHDTAASSYSDLVHGNTYFSPSVEEQALDGNGDGDYDFLRLAFSVYSAGGGRIS